MEAAVQLGKEQSEQAGAALNASAIAGAEQEKTAYGRLAEIEKKAEEERLAAEAGKEGEEEEAGGEEEAE